MKSLDLFLPFLLPKLPGCSEPVALQTLAVAAREFAAETQVLQGVTSPMAVVAGQAEYEIPMPPQADLVQIEQAWYEGRPLALAPRADIVSPLAYTPSIGSLARQSGAPLAAYTTGGATVSLDPPPDRSASAMLMVRFSHAPVVGATEVADPLFDDWLEAVVYGAAYRLALQPSQPYSNSELAAVSLRMSRYFISRARAEARVGRIQGGLSVQMRPFA